MTPISRRIFLKLVAATAGNLLGCSLSRAPSATEEGPQPPPQATATQPESTVVLVVTNTPDSAGRNTVEAPTSVVSSPTASVAALEPGREYSGANLSGWETVLGDAVYAAPGEPPVSLGDIETIHYSDYSELRANILARRIMAHNITFKRIIDADALEYVHTSTYRFLLPYRPSTSNLDLNGETIEGHLSVWDGATARLEYLVAFQWVINPWNPPTYGDINAWDNPGVWKKVGSLSPETAWNTWHTVQMTVDVGRASANLSIDDVQYPCQLVTMSHPDWGNEVAARLAAEIVSIYPGGGNGALHKAHFKDWLWRWETRTAYLPFVMRGS